MWLARLSQTLEDGFKFASRAIFRVKKGCYRSPLITNFVTHSEFPKQHSYLAPNNNSPKKNYSSNKENYVPYNFNYSGHCFASDSSPVYRQEFSTYLFNLFTDYLRNLRCAITAQPLQTVHGAREALRQQCLLRGQPFRWASRGERSTPALLFQVR